MHTTFSPSLPSWLYFAGAQVKLDNMECCITKGRINLGSTVYIKYSHITRSENSGHTNFVTNHNLIRHTLQTKNFQAFRQVYQLFNKVLSPGYGYNENIRLRTAALNKSYLRNYWTIRSPTDINKMHDHIKHTKWMLIWHWKMLSGHRVTMRFVMHVNLSLINSLFLLWK